MSDEFGTVSIRRGAGAREIEVMRGQYRQHRESLLKLITDAPTEHLAVEYQRLIRDIDSSLAKLDELEGRIPTAAPRGGVSPDTNPAMPMPNAVPPAVPPRAATTPSQGDPLRAATEPGSRPLIPAPGQPEGQYETYEPAPANNSSRLILIVIAAIVVLGAIGALIWRASSERKAASSIVSTAPVTDTAPATQPVTPAPKAATPLAIAPEVVDFGTVAKGTRAARQLEITNSTNAPVAIEVSRSQCRCLYYEYAAQVAPKKKETVTVTLDGARAKAGELSESITIKSKKDPTVAATFQVSGTVK